MTNFMFKIKTSSLEIKVAKWYLFCLPFRMILPFEWLSDYIGPLANYTDLLFHLWGLVLWLQNENSFNFAAINRPLFVTLKNSIIFLNASSMVMAVVMYYLYGNYYGHSPFIGVIPMILFYFQYLFMFLYNIRVFSLLSYRQMVTILSKTCTVLLIIGYLQVAAMIGPGAVVYDTIASVVGGLQLSSEIGKLSLTGTEGAAAGSLLGSFVWPFLFARILHRDKSSGYQILLWLIPLYYTHSSTAMLLFVLNFILFVYLMSRYSLSGAKFARRLIGSGCVLIVCAIIFMSFSDVVSSDVTEEINYLVFDKATDKDNASTAARTLPFILSWGCFTELPILGVGNGLQGYFYDKYFPLSFLDYASMDFFYDKRHEGIGNGGCFFTGYFSGYGIIGLFILTNIIYKMRKTFSSRKQNLGLFHEMFIIGAICLIPNGLQGDFYVLYYAWFVLSIPFMYFTQKELKDTYLTLR